MAFSKMGDCQATEVDASLPPAKFLVVSCSYSVTKTKLFVFYISVSHCTCWLALELCVLCQGAPPLPWALQVFLQHGWAAEDPQNTSLVWGGCC